MEVLPAAAVEQQIRAMQELAPPTEISKAIVQAGQDVLAGLIAETGAEGPTFSVIQGGKPPNL